MAVRGGFSDAGAAAFRLQSQEAGASRGWYSRRTYLYEEIMKGLGELCGDSIPNSLENKLANKNKTANNVCV